MMTTGWVLMVGGGLSLAAYVGYLYVRYFLTDPQIPLLVRIPLTVIIAGAILIAVGVIRDRLTGRDQKEE